MQSLRTLGAFISGLALCSVGGLLSVLLTRGPRPIGRGSLPDLLAEAAVFALLLFLLALGWSYLTLRSHRRSRRRSTACCLYGVGLAWLIWLLCGAAILAGDPPEPDLPSGEWLQVILMPLLWGLLSGLAMTAGVLLAALLGERRLLSPPQG
ncbi:hypothetical protein [Paucibacter sp. XJ19-41]|uniref:hypothetical protein n=1 Tax=Paucibacter sp. XJ19-41 TaxID=2927824 RepID=UPI00234B0A54|nr:hypothetical protein [Paucibacter sp. XJ19-41]MDC6167131.1 hypothetical protein [Paucibacter sp. XJ19-41]